MKQSTLNLLTYYGQGAGDDSPRRKFMLLGYVTDGLVEAFDGQYNSVTGHNPTARTWRGVIGGNELAFIGDEEFDWQAKACRFLGVSGYGCFTGPHVGPAICTLEACTWWETNTGTSTYTTVNVKTRVDMLTIANSMRNDNTLGRYVMSRGSADGKGRQFNGPVSGSAIAVNTPTTLACAVSDWTTDSGVTLYRNGVSERASWIGDRSASASTIVIGGSAIAGQAETDKGRGGVFCVRAYNRVLTAAELSRNRAVDVLRFGSSVTPMPDSAGYRRVKCIKGNRDQRLDTGVRGDNDNIVCETEFMYSSWAQYGAVYGAYNSESANTTRTILGATDGSIIAYCNKVASGGGKTINDVVSGQWHYLRVAKDYTTVDNQTVAMNTTSGQALGNKTIQLFQAGTQTAANSIAFKYFNIYDGDQLLRQLLPVVRESDSKPGMYDMVNNVFYTNTGSGEFTWEEMA